MRLLSKKIRHFTTRVLELPQDVLFDLPRVTQIGNRQLYIENHRGVLHFSPEKLILNLSVGRLEIEGKELVIRAILKEEVFLEGMIEQIRHFPS